MICPKCTYEIVDGLLFCPQCGQSLSESEDKPNNGAADDILSDTPFVNALSEGQVLSQDTGSVVSTDPAEPLPGDSSPANAAPVPEVLQEAPLESVIVPHRPGSVGKSSADLQTAEADSKAAVAVPAAVVFSDKKSEVVGSNVVPAAKMMANTTVAQSAPGITALKTSTDETSVEEPPIPKPLKPLTTAGVFWFFFLSSIPCVGFIVLVILAAASKNKSRRSISRAILLWRLVFLLAACLLFTLVFFLNREFLVEIFDSGNWYSTSEFLAKTFLNY